MLLIAQFHSIQVKVIYLSIWWIITVACLGIWLRICVFIGKDIMLNHFMLELSRSQLVEESKYPFLEILLNWFDWPTPEMIIEYS